MSNTLTELRDLLKARGEAQARADSLHQAFRHRTVTDAEQQKFDAACAEVDHLSAQIEALLPAGDQGATASTTASSPSRSAEREGLDGFAAYQAAYASLTAGNKPGDGRRTQVEVTTATQREASTANMKRLLASGAR